MRLERWGGNPHQQIPVVGPVSNQAVDLEQVMLGAKTLAAQIEDGTAKVRGNPEVLKQLASAMVHFELGFDILPGTKGRSPEMDLNPFEVGPVDVTAE